MILIDIVVFLLVTHFGTTSTLSGQRGANTQCTFIRFCINKKFTIFISLLIFPSYDCIKLPRRLLVFLEDTLTAKLAAMKKQIHRKEKGKIVLIPTFKDKDELQDEHQTLRGPSDWPPAAQDTAHPTTEAS